MHVGEILRYAERMHTYKLALMRLPLTTRFNLIYYNSTPYFELYIAGKQTPGLKGG
jgi:glucan phosphorylase